MGSYSHSTGAALNDDTNDVTPVLDFARVTRAATATYQASRPIRRDVPVTRNHKGLPQGPDRILWYPRNMRHGSMENPKKGG